MRYLLAGADLALTITVYAGGVADPDVLDGSDFAAVVRDRYGATTDTLSAIAGNGNGQIDVSGTAVGGYVNGPAWIHVSYLDANGNPRTVHPPIAVEFVSADTVNDVAFTSSTWAIAGRTGPGNRATLIAAGGAGGGTPGPPGADGVGVPTGGTAGQVLTKSSATDYDTGWTDPAAGLSNYDVRKRALVLSRGGR